MEVPGGHLMRGKLPLPIHGNVYVLGAREMDYYHNKEKYNAQSPTTADMRLCIAIKRLILDGFKDANEPAEERGVDKIFQTYYCEWDFAVCYFDCELHGRKPYTDVDDAAPNLVGICLLHIRLPGSEAVEMQHWNCPTSDEVAAMIPFIYVWGLCVRDDHRGHGISKALFEESDHVKDAVLASMRENPAEWEMSEAPRDMPLVLDMDLPCIDPFNDDAWGYIDGEPSPEMKEKQGRLDTAYARTQTIFMRNGFVKMSYDDILRTQSTYTTAREYDEDKEERYFRYSDLQLQALDPDQKNTNIHLRSA